MGFQVIAVDSRNKRRVVITKVENANNDVIVAKAALKEVRLHRFSQNEHTIELIDVMLFPDKPDWQDIYLVTEVMETDLQRIILSKQALTDDHVMYFLYCILRGIIYLHSANIVHCNITPLSILLNSNDDIKYCNLGTAYITETCRSDSNLSMPLRCYQAPEVFMNTFHSLFKADVWSIGCIFAELLGRHRLFDGRDYMELLERIISVIGTPIDNYFIENTTAAKIMKSLPRKEKTEWKKVYPDANPLALDLLDKMIVSNPDRRWSAMECMEHPYLSSIHSTEDLSLASSPFEWTDDFTECDIISVKQMIFQEFVIKSN